MNVDVPNVYCRTDTTWMSTFQMFTAEQTTNQCRRFKCLLLNRHHKWMSAIQMFTDEQTQQMNVDVPNVYCRTDTTNECRRSKCLLLCRHNKWMSTFQMFTAEQTQQMNVDVPNVYCWTETTYECRRSKCLLLNRHNKWMSTFQMFTAEQTHKWMSAIQMFTAEQTQQMNVDVPNVYCWTDTTNESLCSMFTAECTTNECRRSKCLQLNRHNWRAVWMSTFQMFTAEQTQQMNVDGPNVYCWTDTTNECRRSKCFRLNRQTNECRRFKCLLQNVDTDTKLNVWRSKCLLLTHLLSVQ